MQPSAYCMCHLNVGPLIIVLILGYVPLVTLIQAMALLYLHLIRCVMCFQVSKCNCVESHTINKKTYAYKEVLVLDLSFAGSKSVARMLKYLYTSEWLLR